MFFKAVFSRLSVLLSTPPTHKDSVTAGRQNQYWLERNWSQPTGCVGPSTQLNNIAYSISIQFICDTAAHDKEPLIEVRRDTWAESCTQKKKVYS